MINEEILEIWKDKIKLNKIFRKIRKWLIWINLDISENFGN